MTATERATARIRMAQHFLREAIRLARKAEAEIDAVEGISALGRRTVRARESLSEVVDRLDRTARGYRQVKAKDE